MLRYAERSRMARIAAAPLCRFTKLALLLLARSTRWQRFAS